jgi:hypothetical protein
MTTEEHHSRQIDLSAQPLIKPEVQETIVRISMPEYFRDLKKFIVFHIKRKKGDAIKHKKSIIAREGL